MRSSLRKNFLILFILFISLIVNIGSVFYYFYKLNTLSFISMFILSVLLVSLFFYFIIYEPSKQEEKRERFNLSSLFIVLISVAVFYILIGSGSDLVIDSPWSFISPVFFVLLFALILLLIYSKSRLVVLLYLIFFSISFFVYQIAFGYDQLIHQRSMSEILKFGFIEPKTFYYIGQYSLEFFFNRLLSVDLSVISRALVPFLSAILIPLSFIFNSKKNINTVLILLLLLPFSIFTYTVPQNLAFLFLTLIIIFSANESFLKERYSLPFLFSLSLSAFFVHPIAGLSALIFFFILCFRKRRVLVSFAYLAQLLVLPILLFFIGGELSWPSFDLSLLRPTLLGQENTYLNFVYFFFYNRLYIFICLILVSLYLFIKKKGIKNVFVLNFFVLFLSYLLSLFVSFPFLSDIDKSSYPKRLLISSLLFLIPIIFNFFSELVDLVSKKGKRFRFYASIFLALFLLSSLYLNYPRKDNYFDSRAYSVSSFDFEAVRLIEDVKINDNYIVLANQKVGVSAVKEFGFKRYYGDYLYYSVQTGGLLYDYYLKMLEEPKLETIEELLSQLEADNVYIVVNEYWWGYERIVNEMEAIADASYQVGDGKIAIFHFKN